MTSLMQIKDLLTTTVKQIRDTASGLAWYASQLKRQLAQLQDMLEGTTSMEYLDAVHGMNAALNSIEQAIAYLNYAVTVAEEWARTRVGSLIYPNTSPADFLPQDQPKPYALEERSATNSYEHATRTMAESNVFVRQQSQFPKAMLRMIAKERQEAVESAYVNAPPEITAMLQKYSIGLKGIENISRGCYYNPVTRTLCMAKDINQTEYTDIIKHELGHFIDHMLGQQVSDNRIYCYSDSEAFRSAVAQDAQAFDTTTPEGRVHMNELLDDLFSTGACNDRNVTDILSAVLINDPVVTERFHAEGATGYVAYYQHDDGYWYSKNKADGTSYNKREKEVFANMTAIETDQHRIARDFVERWFPNAFACFKSGFEG